MASTVALNRQWTKKALGYWLEIMCELVQERWTMQTFKNSLLAKRTTILLVVLMSLISMVPHVEAAFIPSAESQSGLMRDQDIQIIKKALENKRVEQRFQDLGFSEQEIQERMDQLSDQEVHSLAMEIDSLTQGGIFELAIAVLLIVLLVVVILRLT
jgi:hypothetical protein